jgi:AcrR family transcriptional regulator
MPASSPQRKRRNSYHHGNLRAALIGQAVETIRRDGVEALTLRAVGAGLRVSRTALYRHFSDKSALLAAVATEGFRDFRVALTAAWNDAGRGQAGFEAMGRAYVRFALANPSHYRVMFGGFIAKSGSDPELQREATAAFRVLVDAIVELQQAGKFDRGDPELLARFVWSTVHGIAMLALDGLLQSADAVTSLALKRLRAGIEAR